MYNTTYILGEDKKVRIKITSKLNESFIITGTPTYQLYYNGTLESSGNCIKENGQILSAQIKPLKTGPYLLKITYQIGSETLKTNIGVVVSE